MDRTPTRARTRVRRRMSILAAVLIAGLTLGAPSALAANTTQTSPTTLSGSQTVSSTGITASGLGVTATFDLTTTVNWTQPASLGTSFDPNLVRQGRSLNPSDTYTRPGGPGSISVTWTLKNLMVSWEGVGPLSFDPQSFTASGACALLAGGPDETCNVLSGQVGLLDPGFPAISPYVDLQLGAVVTITPQGLSTVRTTTFGGNPGPTANLSLGESPTSDNLSIPCSVGAGDDLNYSLGSLSTTDSASVDTSLIFDVGAEFPSPIPFDFEDVKVQFAAPTIPLDATSGSIALSGAGASFDLGNVQANNVPPTANAGGSYSGNEGSPISFDGSASNSICGFPTLRWDFSDGGVAFGASPQHTFQGPGVYSGLLTATDATGLTATTPFSVTVHDVAPSVNAGPDTTTAWGRSVAFNGQATAGGSSEQSTLQYSWDFGDGSPSASGGPSVHHAYAQPGTYTATLTVCDAFGMCASSTRNVIVTKRDTSLALAGATSGAFSVPTTISASLVDAFGAPVNAGTISFQVGTNGPFTTMTNSGGIATDSYTPNLVPGLYGETAIFGGNALYNPSNAVSTFNVTVTLTGIEYRLNTDNLTNQSDLNDLYGQLTSADSALRQGHNACQDLGTFVQHTFSDTLGKNPGLTVAQAQALAADANTFQQQIGCPVPNGPQAIAEQSVLGLGGTVYGLGLAGNVVSNLQGQLVSTGQQLAQGNTNSACQSLGKFAQQAIQDATQNSPALTVAQAETLVSGANTIALGLGCSPPTLAETIGEQSVLALSGTLTGLGVASNVTNDLQGQLGSAGQSLTQGNKTSACQSLATFIQHANQDTTGGHPGLTIAQAATLTTGAGSIRTSLGC